MRRRTGRAVRAARIGSLALATLAPVACGTVGIACRRSAPAHETTPPGTRAPSPLTLAEVAYDGALRNGWADLGWAPRDLTHGAANVSFANLGGWMLGKKLERSADFGALVFRMKAPPTFGDFLEVRVESNAQLVFPRIAVGPQHRADVGEGWTEVLVPLAELDPTGAPFEKIVLRARRPVGSEWVLLDKIAFTRAGAQAGASTGPVRDATMLIDCHARAPRISPAIYGIGFDAQEDAKSPHVWELGATARRWGGNPTSRYNWELEAWNAANDWYFENVQAPAWRAFLRENVGHHVQSVVTVPMLGWVAKDTTSASFPTAAYPAQEKTDPQRPEAGNGVGKDGKPLPPGPPTRTSVAISPDYVSRWVNAIRDADAKAGTHSVQMYILDNEPGIWGGTHRDVHPDPTTYDELLQKTIAYGAAVRAADPDALIAGPAEWGWPNFFYSGKDLKAGLDARPDRRAHGDVPLLAWYLQRLREYERKTGTRILDVVDVHWYPQGDKVGGRDGATDPATAAARIRATRSLWDPDYLDESWVREVVRLLPRMKELIAQNDPGRGLSIGEWNFGADTHMSGGLATAEALGRFAQYEVASAFYYTYPRDRSPAFWAFRAYRNYDGAGARFLDYALSTMAAPGTSLFASRDAGGKHVVAVALNFAPDTAVRTRIDMASCGRVVGARSFTYAGGDAGFTAGAKTTPKSLTVDETLPPYSITVLDLELGEPMKGVLGK